jgi:hypothetical protein
MGMTPHEPPARTDAFGRAESMVVGPPLARVGGGQTVVTYPVSLQAEEDTPRHWYGLTFRVHREMATDTIGLAPGLAATLMPAMATRRDLRAAGPVSPLLLRGMARYQSIYHAWNHDYRTCRIVAEEVPDEPVAGPRGVALLFSGGVDSMFALADGVSGLTDLVFVSGFDVAPDHGEHARMAVEHARAAAREHGLGFVEVETDARFSGDRFLRWEDYGGSLLGAVALLLRPLFHSVRVAPDYAWEDLRCESVHPMLHDCWRSEDGGLKCESAASNRAEKCARLAARPDLLRHLRVCWEMSPTSLNCGRCEKCLRSLAGLAIFDAAIPAGVFGAPADPSSLRDLEVMPKWVPFYEQLLAAAVARGATVWAEVLRDCLDRAELRQIAAVIHGARKEIPDSTAWQNHAGHLRDRLFDGWSESDPAWLDARIHRQRSRWREVLAPTLAAKGKFRHWKAVARLRILRAWRKWWQQRATIRMDKTD